WDQGITGERVRNNRGRWRNASSRRTDASSRAPPPPNGTAKVPGPPSKSLKFGYASPRLLQPPVMLRLYGFEPGITSVDDAVQVIFPSNKSRNARPISCKELRSMVA